MQKYNFQKIRFLFTFFPVAFLGVLSPLCYGQSLCVKSETANLRSGPGYDFKILWEVKKSMPLLALEEKNGWIKVQDKDGDSSWILSQLVARDKSCAMVKAKKVFLRTGPGINFPVVESKKLAREYESFQLKESKGEWAHLIDEDGMSYWAQEQYLWIPLQPKPKAKVNPKAQKEKTP